MMLEVLRDMISSPHECKGGCEFHDDECAAAMRPFCQLTLDTCYSVCVLCVCVCVCVDNCSDLRNNRISVIEDGAFDGMHQLEEL